MALAVCVNPDCERVLDVPGLSRTYRTPTGECAKCAGLTLEQIMELPATIVSKFVPLPKPELSGADAKIEIANNVPLPSNAAATKGRCWIPLEKLRKPRPDGSADSVLVRPSEGQDSAKLIARARTTANKWAKNNKIKIVTRTEGDGLRIWRIA